MIRFLFRSKIDQNIKNVNQILSNKNYLIIIFKYGFFIFKDNTAIQLLYACDWFT